VVFIAVPRSLRDQNPHPRHHSDLSLSRDCGVLRAFLTLANESPH
jgi:hypothetical protein